MPAIRVVMPDGTTKSFREGTPKSVIRHAIRAMQAEMAEQYGDRKFDVVVTGNTPVYNDFVQPRRPDGSYIPPAVWQQSGVLYANAQPDLTKATPASNPAAPQRLPGQNPAPALPVHPPGAALVPRSGELLKQTPPVDLAKIDAETQRNKPAFVFIGGFGDALMGDPGRTVKDYADKFGKANPGAEVNYFSWDDKDGIDAWMKQRPPGSKPYVFGQSYGADRAAYAVRTNPGVAEKLYTIDGIGSINRAGRGTRWDEVRDGAGEWTAVKVAPSPLRHLDYWWADAPKGYASDFVEMPDLQHADFFGAMDHLRERGKLPPGMKWDIKPR